MAADAGPVAHRAGAARHAAGGGAGNGGGRGRAGKRGGGPGGDGGGGRDRPPAGRVVVDPRMRARRIRVRRDAGQRRLRRVARALALLVVVAAAVGATQSPLLDVDRVEVAGASRTPAGDVLRAAAIEPGDPMLPLDVDAAARRVEDLPWVDHATVERRWPATVNVHVSEREPAALVELGADESAVVDDEGRVLAVGAAPGGDEGTQAGGGAPGEAAGGDPAGAGSEAPGLAVLTGVDGQLSPGDLLDHEARDALRVAVAVAERMPGQVASVSTELDAALVSGGVVRFGDVDDLAAKVTAAKTALEEVDTACLEVLDVRVPGTAALTRNQGCS